MTPVDFDDHLNWFHDHAVTGKTNGAVRFAVDLLDAGNSQTRIISDVLAASQRQVGTQWQRNEISVAEEHLATGVTESALYAISSGKVIDPALGSVVVARAEGDWHSLKGHMFSEQLRAEGLDVTFLGASTPSGEVARFIQRRRPDAVLVTCNLPVFFPGVVSLANVAHESAIPVLVGGRAVVDAPDRARRLGSDAIASNVTDVLSTLARWRVLRCGEPRAHLSTNTSPISSHRARPSPMRRSRGCRSAIRPSRVTPRSNATRPSSTFATSSSSWPPLSTSMRSRSSPTSWRGSTNYFTPAAYRGRISHSHSRQ